MVDSRCRQRWQNYSEVPHHREDDSEGRQQATITGHDHAQSSSHPTPQGTHVKVYLYILCFSWMYWSYEVKSTCILEMWDSFEVKGFLVYILLKSVNKLSKKPLPQILLCGVFLYMHQWSTLACNDVLLLIQRLRAQLYIDYLPIVWSVCVCIM